MIAQGNELPDMVQGRRCQPLHSGIVREIAYAISLLPLKARARDCSGKPAGFAFANPRTWSGKPGPRALSAGEAPKIG
jgi:hypothetical protein